MRYAAIAALTLAIGPMSGALASPANPPSHPRVALVLSGGAALGIAHVGVVRELERAGIPIDMVLGTSMGALVGGLYASGYSPDAMQELIEGLDFGSLFGDPRDTPVSRDLFSKHRRFPFRVGFEGRGASFGKGLVRGQGILALFTSLTAHMLPQRNFDDFPVPYRAVAADIVTGEKVVLSSGSIAEAMRASMSIPGLFAPYESEGRSLVDGGILDNMPVELARSMGADIVIAVECRTRAVSEASQLSSSLAVLNQTLALSIESNMRPSRDSADLLIRPDLSGYGRADFVKARELIERGEAGAREAGDKIRALAGRIAASRPPIAPEKQANRLAMRDPPEITRLEIEAKSRNGEEIARKAFSGLVGRAPARSDIEAAIGHAYSSGSFSLVKLDLLPELGEKGGERAIARATLIDGAAVKNEVMLAIDYRGLLSPFVSSRLLLAPAVLLGDVLGKDSAFFAELGVGNATRARAELLLPAGPFSATSFMDYQAQSETYAAGKGLGLQLDTWSAAGGVLLSADLGRRADVRAGYTFRVIHGTDIETTSESETEISSLANAVSGSLCLEVRADTMNTAVFPERGLSLDLLASWSDPAIGGERSLLTAECEAAAAIPLTRRLTLALAAKAAIDGSLFLDGFDSLPFLCSFSLRSRDMFYGLEPNSWLGSGNGALGGALELRANLGRLHPLVDSDLIGLANVSFGLAHPIVEDAADGWYPSLDIAIGLGARVFRDFGARLTASLVADLNPFAPIRPALGLQIGSMADPISLRR